MEKVAFLFMLIFVSLISGCAHWHSQNKASLSVEVIAKKSSLPRDCKPLSKIEGRSIWGRELAMIELKRSAVERAASHVVLDQTDFGFWQQAYLGVAYSCEKVDSIGSATIPTLKNDREIK